MIRHTVVFNLKWKEDSVETKSFFQKSLLLAGIRSVENFEMLKQVSDKNKFSYGFSMEFADQKAYDYYNLHPEHVKYVKEIWVPNVTDFMEIDYIPLV